jgi:hypothetical protein
LRHSADAAKAQWRRVADQLRPKLPKLASFVDEAETDVLAYRSFPAEHWSKLHPTNGLERLNGEIKRRTEVVGIFPNDEAIVRLVGAILLEQNDEWAVQRARSMTLETMASLSDDPLVGSPAELPSIPTPRRISPSPSPELSDGRAGLQEPTAKSRSPSGWTATWSSASRRPAPAGKHASTPRSKRASLADRGRVRLRGSRDVRLNARDFLEN